ncbi:MAG: hypothetical protein WCK67_12290 [bacterium]
MGYFNIEQKPYGTMGDRYGIPDDIGYHYGNASSSVNLFDRKEFNKIGNNDGFISKEEYVKAQLDTSKMPEWQKEMMKDSSLFGKNRNSKKLEKIFDSVDINKDGKLDIKELMALSINDHGVGVNVRSNLDPDFEKREPAENRKILKSIFDLNKFDNNNKIPDKPADVSPFDINPLFH